MSPKHEIQVRVYYEDTDFSGRVYHASYLRFLERGRTEWLRAQGFEHRLLAGSHGLVFAVRNLQVDYLAPALMDDLLIVETSPRQATRAVIAFNQSIVRQGTTLLEAVVQVVTLKGDRAARPPRELLDRIGAVTRLHGGEFGRQDR